MGMWYCMSNTMDGRTCIGGVCVVMHERTTDGSAGIAPNGYRGQAIALHSANRRVSAVAVLAEQFSGSASGCHRCRSPHPTTVPQTSASVSWPWYTSMHTPLYDAVYMHTLTNT